MTIKEIAESNWLESLVTPVLEAGRVPGAAVAIVKDGQLFAASGFGYRDLARRIPCEPGTIYPVASTSKGINAALIALLADEGTLDWDVPIRSYVPELRFADFVCTEQATLRDLVLMRTGLPRHDMVWLGVDTDRAALARRLADLPFSFNFRERFQYNNLTVTLAGHVAERVTGRPWEALVTERLLIPLGMTCTGFSSDPALTTRAYRETIDRSLVEHRPLPATATAPSGGAIFSSVTDMARWALLHCDQTFARKVAVLRPETIGALHRPQILGLDAGAPSADAAYGGGWFVDSLNGVPRISHGGDLNGINSHLMLFPTLGLGMVTFTNFGAVSLASLINAMIAARLLHMSPPSLDERLAVYEQRVAETAAFHNAMRRVADTAPSHRLDDYVGAYGHAGYGCWQIVRRGDELSLVRDWVDISLKHWHYDSWAPAEPERFGLQRLHPFGFGSRMLFETDVEGRIAALTVHFEPAVEPIRLTRVAAANGG